MSKEFKRCPRCNTKTHINLRRCGSCGLNYDKFNSATNAEAKSAFRMNEKNRVLLSKTVPSDINKVEIFVQSLLGGWFGLHYFKIGRIWRGIVQFLGFVFAFVYAYGAGKYGIRSGYLGYLILLCGIVWVFTFVTWITDCFAILFNRFKYPVSLPYSYSELKQSSGKKVIKDIAQNEKSSNVVENKNDQPDNPQANKDEKSNNLNEGKGE